MDIKKSISTIVVFGLFSCGSAFAEEQITMKKSVVDTLGYAPRLEMIKNNREAVGHDLDKSKGRWYPKLDVRGGIGADAYHTKNQASENDGDWDERGEIGGYLTQRLYDGGEASSQIRLDETRFASLEERVFDNAESLALDAIIAAQEVYRNRELVFLGEENVKAHRDILASLQEREKAGAGSVADVTQTQARLSMALGSLEKSRKALKASLSNFQRLTGYLPGKIDKGAYSSKYVASTLEEMTAAAKTGNPKVKAAEEDIKSEQERINIAKSNYHPYVYGELSSTYSDGVQDNQDWERTDAAMVRFNWNLFNGGSDVAATKAAKSRKKQSESDRDDLVLAVEDETKVTWAEFKSATAEIKDYKDALTNNRATKETYLEQFSVGQRSLLDVLDAENDVYSSAILLTTSTVNEQVAAYKLMALAGSLITALEVDPQLYKSAARTKAE